MSYTNKANIQNLLLITISDSFDSQISEWISAAEAWINTYCGREFEQESSTYKLYDGSGTKELLIDDLLTFTKVETLDLDGDVDETVDSSSMYWLYPANKSPKYKIRLNPANSPVSVFPKGHQNIKVTGTFGYSSSVPSDVKLATTKLVGAMIRESQTDVTAQIESEKLGEYSVTFSDISKLADRLGVKDILNQYRIINV